MADKRMNVLLIIWAIDAPSEHCLPPFGSSLRVLSPSVNNQHTPSCQIVYDKYCNILGRNCPKVQNKNTLEIPLLLMGVNLTPLLKVSSLIVNCTFLSLVVHALSHYIELHVCNTKLLYIFCVSKYSTQWIGHYHHRL